MRLQFDSDMDIARQADELKRIHRRGARGAREEDAMVGALSPSLDAAGRAHVRYMVGYYFDGDTLIEVPTASYGMSYYGGEYYG